MNNESESHEVILTDVQSRHDMRRIPIDKVGVRNIKYPIQVLDCEHGYQHTIGTVSLTVDLPHQFKGTHMSRFMQVLNEHRNEISVESIPKMLDRLRERLDAENAHFDVTFPFFLQKKAPVTGECGIMEYECGFSASSGEVNDFVISCDVMVTTLCPCSKEISARGAHNQRGLVSARVRTNAMVWLEEIIQMIESRASCDLYPVLKRPDEKYVTEKAYDNPRFVEDIVREVALAFIEDERIVTYEIEAENFESIHAHNAYAYLTRDKRVTP